MSKVNIVGSGLVGSLLSILLKKEGFDVNIFEKRSDPRYSSHFSGRSINLALSHRGLVALKTVDIASELDDLMIPMKARMIHHLNGDITTQAYGINGEFINSVSRGNLNKLLVEKAESMGVEVYFDHLCDSFDPLRSEITFHNGQKEKADLTVGTDGAFSSIREGIQKQDRFNYSQFYIDYGYKELTIPGHNGEFSLAPNYLHIWPRGNFMLIALPNIDKSFTCTLFLPFEGHSSFEEINQKGIIEFFETEFPDALNLMPNLEEEYARNPTSSMITVQCTPWYQNRAILLGDAAHAFVPFYGQGMNCGLEDIQLFIKHAKEHHFDWDQALPTFSATRKVDTDAISELALANFIEMRDLVTNERFLRKKELEKAITQKYPTIWIPQYSLVTFSSKPYSEAQRIGKIQDELLEKYLDAPEIDTIIDEFNILTKGEMLVDL